ncbi:unnamed protein product [Zymoseptoria tritici ST99CH_1E4]|uniref:Uncharacterized protein n=1 Tax=Zymoseptoria tritici ST99CH_1E4 TaxID=1276532 RepID=A0A2H1G5U8_ZYMTR|nr:unnamed protein product [Zymoseptoria tritici ST99CH_1E4]
MSLNAGTELLEPNVTPNRLIENLQRQADLAATQTQGELAIDQPENAGNFKLWVELLQYRQRIDGFRGVLEVWKGLRRRRLDLPVRGQEADILWGTFINAGVESDGLRAQFLRRVCEYAENLDERTCLQYPALHKCIVGRLLRVSPQRAPDFHDRLVASLGTIHVDIRSLASDCANSQDHVEARNAFMQIYSRSEQEPMYDAFMTEMLKCEDEEIILSWHRFFIKDGDKPSLEMAATPGIRRLYEMDNGGSLPARLRKRIDKFESARAKEEILQHLPLTRAKMSTIVGDVHGIKQKELGDNFVAKMFATRAFPLDMVIKGLEFFGIEKLGPLALREMALRAGSFVEFSNKLTVVEAKGIVLDTSVYGRLVQKLTMDGSVQLFDTLIQSDQHPESCGDIETQELLLVDFLEKEDWLNAHLTLMGLSLSGQNGHARAWNRLLQGYIKQHDFRAIARTAQQMQAANMAFTKRTLTFMHRYVLPVRRIGRAPEVSTGKPQWLEPLQFTTNAFIYAAQCGVAVNPLLWKENLKRYGMLHRWDEVEQLVLWLVQNYSAKARPRPYKLRGRIREPKGVLQWIFNRQMRFALFVWAFRRAWHGVSDRYSTTFPPTSSVTSSSGRTCEPWAKGLLLLKRMGDYGISTTPELARNAFLTRMWILFGPAASTNGLNEKVRLHNTRPLAYFVKHANEIWDGELFDLDPELLKVKPQNQARLMVAIFGRRRLEKSSSYCYTAFSMESQPFPSGQKYGLGAET